ncbi:MAG: D-(-)-3-hydroxybutyrate oligomer hydrolase, partial [Rhizobacter sp.]|nr:D-(-)-3-hydroxybutyrate oligomer hydrolase [Rhizobacter sp.]
MTMRMRGFQTLSLALVAAAALVACGGGGDDSVAPTEAAAAPAEQAQHLGAHAVFNRKPEFVSGDVLSTEYDGVSDDLLTAGLGKSGLAGALPPFANGLLPTAAELRRAAIYNSYRAIVDMTAAGGYGSLYGPNVDADGVITASEGKVAGAEYIAFSDDGSGQQNVVLMVQVPSHFNPRRACIITATSSGSRGVYGGISTGEWGLKRGCAVAYTDKGTGSGPHDLASDTVPLIDGTRA